MTLWTSEWILFTLVISIKLITDIFALSFIVLPLFSILNFISLLNWFYFSHRVILICFYFRSVNSINFGCLRCLKIPYNFIILEFLWIFKSRWMFLVWFCFDFLNVLRFLRQFRGFLFVNLLIFILKLIDHFLFFREWHFLNDNCVSKFREFFFKRVLNNSILGRKFPFSLKVLRLDGS